MAVPIFETFTVTNSSSNSTSLIVPAPAGLVENDMIIIAVSLDGVDGDPQSTGFTQFGAASQGAVEQAYLIKRATDSEPANYTVVWTGNERARITVIRVSGCPTTGTALDQVDVIGAADMGAAGNSVAVPAITSTIIDTLAIAMVSVDRAGIQSGDGLSDAQGYVDEGIAGNGGALGAGQMLASKDLSTGGSSLSPTFGWSGAAEQFVTNQFNLMGVSPSPGFAHSQAVIVG